MRLGIRLAVCVALIVLHICVVLWVFGDGQKFDPVNPVHCVLMGISLFSYCIFSRILKGVE